ncbi:MAG TPA: MarR family transcriptional regulator [Dermatophilaceae bacterium]|nr:MarR family transcriptional regulator [Dermatophilaceae bacterium]
MPRATEADGIPAFVERVADEFVRAGMTRMPSRVFAAIMMSDQGRLTSAELCQRLRASPAAISGAVRFLEQQGMLRRTREPGGRRDLFTIGDDAWYETLSHRESLLKVWETAMGDGAAIAGPDTPAGRRLAEMQEFFAFVGQEMPLLLERWREHRDRLRRAAGSQER